MNKILCFLSALCFIACNNQKEKIFTVEGTARNGGGALVYLEMNTQERPVIVDSARLGADGRFSVNTNSPEEAFYSLRIDNNPYPFAILISDSKKVTVDADLASAGLTYTVKGSEASQALLDFEKTMGEQAQNIYTMKLDLDSIMKIKKGDSAFDDKDSLYAVVNGRYESALKQMKLQATQMIEASRSPMFVLYAIGAFQRRTSQIGEPGFMQDEIATIMEKASARFPAHKTFNEQKERMAVREAPEFSLPDTSGKDISLASFRGKYVLVDFWASWCAPCRRENPNVVAAYHQFKDRNFTVLGVSLDRDREAWVKAIRDDSLTWTHVSDLQFWNNAAAILYGVESIPYNVLIDPNGKIIATRLAGEDLPNTLRQVLKN